ncbi:SDR family NAD(P)-dependent oxidoreductase [Sphingomonas sp. LY54]|uniref:SDR family NAD(P)-dependent oxidoreductase n=1 Tax=Sphingomonas sp. LY54 TaxID=3095343 RepID=UPI002D790FA8|nr:SDR family NAD(P)-dependent oxidoreductase [Sphingomonas sp. LY54]WRP28180.1 SDR family NAD(P)-dependent oxidoreductase [Sphingomonas sp. LY54]
MTNELSGRAAIVTGGASGIGAATARLLAARGAAVLVVDRDAAAADALCRDIADAGGRTQQYLADLTDTGAANGAVAAALDAFGRLDILINNAGIGARGPSHELGDTEWRRVLALNLDSVFYMARAALRPMLAQEGGAIVNIASIFGHVGIAERAAYSASKAGVVNLTRALALEYGRRGIRVNAVCPGVIRTPLIAHNEPRQLAALADLHPLGRLGEAGEVAQAIAFLASDAASFVTGSSLMVDGGYTAA